MAGAHYQRMYGAGVFGSDAGYLAEDTAQLARFALDESNNPLKAAFIIAANANSHNNSDSPEVATVAIAVLNKLRATDEDMMRTVGGLFYRVAHEQSHLAAALENYYEKYLQDKYLPDKTTAAKPAPHA